MSFFFLLKIGMSRFFQVLKLKNLDNSDGWQVCNGEKIVDNLHPALLLDGKSEPPQQQSLFVFEHCPDPCQL